jgi:hypothetical protein
MQYIKNGFSTVTSGIRYGAGAAASMVKTATVQGIEALNDRIERATAAVQDGGLDAGLNVRAFSDAVKQMPDRVASSVGAAADRAVETYDAVMDTRAAKFFTRGKIGQVITQNAGSFAGSVVSYVMFTPSEEDSTEASMLKTAVATGYILYKGYNIAQGRKYTSGKEMVRDYALLTGATALAVVAPGVVAPTTSWMMGKDVAKKLVGTETPVSADTANEFGASVVTNIVVPGGGIVTRLVMNAAASKALPRIVSGERPTGSGALSAVVKTIEVANTAVDVLRNPMAHAKKAGTEAVKQFLQGMMPDVLPKVIFNAMTSSVTGKLMSGLKLFMSVKEQARNVVFAYEAFCADATLANAMYLKSALEAEGESTSLLDDFLTAVSSHITHITLHGFPKFMDLMASEEIAVAHQAFKKEPSEENAQALQAAMQKSLSSFLGYKAVHASLQSTVASIVDGQIPAQFKNLESLFGFNVVAANERYLETMARLFFTAFVPYIMVDPSLTKAITKEEEAQAGKYVVAVARGAVEQIVPRAGVVVDVVAKTVTLAQNALPPEEAPTPVAVPSHYSPIAGVIVSFTQRIFLGLAAFFYAIYGLFQPAAIRKAKAATGPAKLVVAEAPRIKLSSLSQMQKLSLVSAAAIA